uniref:Protein Iojap, chloroplastic n=1 Tax=Leersia perrieri TaxID=77586 RepID=A0A0D9XF69_9ORYZ
MRGAALVCSPPGASASALIPWPRYAGLLLQHRLRSDLPPPRPLLPCRARSPSSSSSNVVTLSNALNSGRGDDADNLLEDLLSKHGEVVYNAGGAPGIDADDDAECLSFAVSLAKVASEVKAADIRVLFVKPLVYWTRFFIILTAFSNAQIDAISSKMRDIGEKQFSIVASGDTKANSWTLLDFGDVVVHIFLPQQRAFYNLEEFYGNATSIELPFESHLQ